MAVLTSSEGLRSAAPVLRELQRAGERMLSALGLAQSELSILLCDDALIHQLNREHRAVDRATDVLAFAMWEAGTAPPQRAMLGDVVISLDTARRQASEHARSVHDELVFLLAHGLLHLLGCDHRDDTEERRMSARTDLLRATAIPRAPARKRARP